MRPTEINLATLATLFRKEFQLCNVKKGETIAVVSDLNARRDYVAAAFAAASDLGADIYEMCVNSVPSWTKVGVETIGHSKGTLDALSKADIIVILHIPLFTKWLKAVRDAGARVLMVIDAPEMLESLMSPPDLKPSTIYAGDRLRKAKEMRVLSDAGTDLRVSLGEYPVMISTAFGIARPLRPLGRRTVHTFPNEGTSNGTVVFQPGDIVILPYCRYRRRIEVRIKCATASSQIKGGLDAN